MLRNTGRAIIEAETKVLKIQMQMDGARSRINAIDTGIMRKQAEIAGLLAEAEALRITIDGLAEEVKSVRAAAKLEK